MEIIKNYVLFCIRQKNWLLEKQNSNNTGDMTPMVEMC